jgi:hypothetical protein
MIPVSIGAGQEVPAAMEEQQWQGNGYEARG